MQSPLGSIASPAWQTSHRSRSADGAEPSPHRVQFEDLRFATAPSGHGVHSVPLGECFPAGQSSHRSRSADGAKPASHRVHFEDLRFAK